MNDHAPCMWMRGGTSKGAYFLTDDLPEAIAMRDAFLLSVMGSPDTRQIDGMGGADPLTSKVAIVQASKRNGIDVEYLFLQVAVDQPLVSDNQNCGNMLAGVGPFAIERGLVAAAKARTSVTILMVNTGQIATAVINTPNGEVSYSGDQQIDGVPGTASAIEIEFSDTAGSTCGALLPTGPPLDVVDGIEVTMIDNGMPCVVLRAADMGISGTETRKQLDADTQLRSRLEALRLKCGRKMKLGDVADKTVPKMSMISPAINGGTLSTRTFIPHRCHASIGVFGAVSVATACLLPGTIAAAMAVVPGGRSKTLQIEHPLGTTAILAKTDDKGNITSTAIIRTARKLFDGVVFAASHGSANR